MIPFRRRRFRPALYRLHHLAVWLRWLWLQDRVEDWLFPQQARERKRYVEPVEGERPCGS